MLKVVKTFTDAVKADKEWGCESKGPATVMLNTKITPELKRQGLSREITNRIQRLRKTSGISIEDQIDIYYSVVGESPEITAVLDTHQRAIADITRMPVMEASLRDMSAPFVGETEFIDPDNEAEHVKLYIHMAQPVFNDDRLQAEFNSHNTEQRDFVSLLKSYVKQFNPADLSKRVKESNDTLTLRLDGVDVTLKRGDHFFLNNKDRNSSGA
mmetsp:Transcript_30324/g.40291  ORF Transcript_30324/g.40291 Transcript_30324/m.40291 type:complete len:213 (-) Transcript_30324:54-692(-)